MEAMENVMRLDLHCLIGRFAQLRVPDPVRLRVLVRSLEQHGQLVPVVAVPAEGEPPRWVLIDGYRRLEGLRQLGQDLVWVDVWDRSGDEALAMSLARAPERPWRALEEAAMIDELSRRHSLRELARRLGRDVSWVSRRAELYSALPEDLLGAVRRGVVSPWAASRVLVPLARANAAHARTLLGHLEGRGLSTRDLKRLFTHYQQSNHVQRERLVQAPELFLKALRSQAQARQAKRLAAGPEGAWCEDLERVRGILERLLGQVPTVFAPEQEAACRTRLAQAFTRTRAVVLRLEQCLEDTRP